MRRVILTLIPCFFLAIEITSSALGTEEQPITWRDFAVAKPGKALPHKRMTKKEFLEHFKGNLFMRILDEKENLQDGLNEFKDFLDFTTLNNIHLTCKHNTRLRVCAIPEGATIEPCKDKFKANKLFLEKIVSLEQIEREAKLIEAGREIMGKCYSIMQSTITQIIKYTDQAVQETTPNPSQDPDIEENDGAILAAVLMLWSLLTCPP